MYDIVAESLSNDNVWITTELMRDIVVEQPRRLVFLISRGVPLANYG